MKIIQANKLTKHAKMMLRAKWEEQHYNALKNGDEKLAMAYLERIDLLEK